jgi:hypothetical protein
MATSLEQMPLQDISFKASHNSYNRDETIQEQLYFDRTAPYQCGCRGLELDIWRHSSDQMNKEFFTVGHTIMDNNTNLSVYLDQILSWYNTTTDHGLVWVMLDIKSSDGDCSTFPNEIDTYLTDYFGRDLIANPKFIFPDFTDSTYLSDLVAQQGWSPLGTLQNKFIFCLSGTEEWKSVYVNQYPSTRLCFADSGDVGLLSKQNQRIVYNVKAGDEKQNDFDSLQSKNIFIRVYDTNSDKDWNTAIQMGANMLATNKVSDYKWAEVSTNAPFAQTQ